MFSFHGSVSAAFDLFAAYNRAHQADPVNQNRMNAFFAHIAYADTTHDFREALDVIITAADHNGIR